MTFKTTVMALAAIACMASTARADIVTVSGSTSGGPTFNRPLEDLSGLSLVGTAVAYDAFQFSVSVAGDYTFVTTGFAPAGYDTFALLYTAPFMAGAPLTNALAASDDLFGVGLASGFAYALAANTSYVYVTTGFGNTDAGSFVNVIGGPGVITAAVPEPQTVLLMALGIAALGAAGGIKRQRSALA